MKKSMIKANNAFHYFKQTHFLILMSAFWSVADEISTSTLFCFSLKALNIGGKSHISGLIQQIRYNRDKKVVNKQF